jgi:hypothetical protein
MSDRIESEILKLIEEDDYGSWELWWRVSNREDLGEPAATLADDFVQTIQDMVSRDIVKPKRRSKQSGKLEVVPFSARELAEEVSHSSAPLPEKVFGSVSEQHI